MRTGVRAGAAEVGGKTAVGCGAVGAIWGVGGRWHGGCCSGRERVKVWRGNGAGVGGMPEIAYVMDECRLDRGMLCPISELSVCSA